MENHEENEPLKLESDKELVPKIAGGLIASQNMEPGSRPKKTQKEIPRCPLGHGLMEPSLSSEWGDYHCRSCSVELKLG